MLLIAPVTTVIYHRSLTTQLTAYREQLTILWVFDQKFRDVAGSLRKNAAFTVQM